MDDDIRIALIEDQRQTREGLATLVAGTPGCRVVGSFASMEEALAGLVDDPANIALLDVQLPGMSGIEGVSHLRSRFPDLQVLMLTVYADNARVFEAICAGASGYLLKDTPPARLIDAIRELYHGGAPMSPEIARKVVTMFQRTPPPKDETQRLSGRELEILRLLADGHSYKTAAATLAISVDTVRFHVRHIYEKLHVHSKSEAVLRAFRAGLLS
jgi:DNA-binding NarL/FixJ family response regulator